MIPASLRRLLRNLSIKRKLTAIVTVTSGLAVVLASAGFLALDHYSFRRQMVSGLEATAQNIGLFAAPALDPRLARSAVAAQADRALNQFLDSLRAYASIEEAAIFDASGQLRGLKRPLLRQDEPPPPYSADNWEQFGDGQLVLYRRVTTPDGEFVGVVRLQSNTHALAVRLQQYLVILAGVTVVSLLASLLLASQLQKVISGPILHLAEIETRVSRERD